MTEPQTMDTSSNLQTGSVLFVVDMQECYLNGYKDQEYVRGRIDCVNRTIAEARSKGVTLIFIEHEFTGVLLRLVLKLFWKGAGIRGFKGFPTDGRIDRQPTDPVYLKFEEDLFSVGSVVERLKRDRVENVVLVGQDGIYCIQGSARGGKSRGFGVTILDSGVATRSERKWRACKAALLSEGVRIVSA